MDEILSSDYEIFNSLEDDELSILYESVALQTEFETAQKSKQTEK